MNPKRIDYHKQPDGYTEIGMRHHQIGNVISFAGEICVCDNVNDSGARFRPVKNKSESFHLANSHEPSSGLVVRRMTLFELSEFLFPTGNGLRIKLNAAGQNERNSNMKTEVKSRDISGRSPLIHKLKAEGKTKAQALEIVRKKIPGGCSPGALDKVWASEPRGAGGAKKAKSVKAPAKKKAAKAPAAKASAPKAKAAPKAPQPRKAPSTKIPPPPAAVAPEPTEAPAAA